MKHRLLFLLAAFSLPAFPQPWSTFLDPSRAIDWTSVGFTIPNYTVNCATQPTLVTGSGAASANATAIQNALASCDATHSVVNIQSGTYYVASFQYGQQGHQVVRGAGPLLTTLIMTSEQGCDGAGGGICINTANYAGPGSDPVLPPSGTQQCLWTGGFSQGTTQITLSSCPGGPPSLGHMLVLDQADDDATGDNGGIYLCDSFVSNCTVENSSDNAAGRRIGNITHATQQIVRPTSIVSAGGGSYIVTIPQPGLFANNYRTGMSAGAWWAYSPDIVQEGLENLTVDATSIPDATVDIAWCYQCWVKNVTILHPGKNAVKFFISLNGVLRDSYVYSAQTAGTESYGILAMESSNLLIENNIFQQLIAPVIFGQGSGCVVAYNFSIQQHLGTNYVNGAYYNHNAGNHMNLWEGNNMVALWADDSWGTSHVGTYFRNFLFGWDANFPKNNVPIEIDQGDRGFNLVGNVLGKPGVHTVYESYATSSSGGVNQSNGGVATIQLGWTNAGYDTSPTCQSPPVCDPLVRSTLMRWGNYDTANAAVRWDSTEASPAAVAYINTNFTSSYFGTLAHTLPASLHYNSKPSWWPGTIAWPAVGPDVAIGNLATCAGGTYAGFQATSASSCTGGTISSVQWASHAAAIPAQNCYLNVMSGTPDGSGGVLNFDARLCYGSTTADPPTSTAPASPTNLTATVQ